ncbi:MAG: hypothetical protein E7Z72_07050 [Methanocorpusculum parvum]|nr:hypothetical protein [Methanocorpusculum parvum]
MTGKPDESEYEKLYLVARLVYNGEIEADKASAKLSGIIGSPDVYNKVIFAMYAGMKNGRVFQHSGGDESVVYFLRRIAQDDGPEALEKALNAVYGYTGFKGSVGCPMPELEDACDALKVIYGIHNAE